jgi:TPR repeat protein
MENISSETCLFDDNITAVDIILHSSFFDTSATTHQFLKHHTTHQVDKFQQQTITSSTKSSSFSIASHEQVEEEENEKLRPTTSLVNNKDILSRVYAAQCKLYGFFETQKNVNAEEEGFRELYELKEYPEAYYPLGCWYYDQSDYRQAYAWFEKCSNNNSSAKYRMALLLLLHEHSNPNLEKAFHLMTESANEGNYYAQFMLGVYHQRGILVKKMNFQLAKMWYERSAIQGFAEAQTALCNLLIQMNMSSFKHNGVDYNKEEKQLYIEEEINKSAIKEALDWLYRAENQVIIIRKTKNMTIYISIKFNNLFQLCNIV